MNRFSDKDFLLTTPTAKSLFQSIAGLPVIDCCCSLTAKEIAEGSCFDNISKLWLNGDPKKLQAMRAFGIDEYYITGEAGDYEKFQKWAETVPYLPQNPLYHRTHLELQRYFGIFDPLSPVTAEQIWNQANRVIAAGGFSASELFQKFNVETVCTPEDPVDSLLWHQKIAEDGICSAKVLPAFCPHNAFAIESPAFSDWLAQLEGVCSQAIESYASLQSCLTERLLFFKSVGGKTALQTLSLSLTEPATAEQADAIFRKAKNKQPLTQTETAAYQAHLLSFLAKKYQDYGFSLEIQAETAEAALGVVTLLEKVNQEHKLPKIVIAPKNLSDANNLAKRIHQSNIAGLIRMGGCEEMFYQKDAIKEMLHMVATNGILPLFTGFSTGMNGILSYPAHEYFRRVLSDFLGDLVESGEYPNYIDLLKKFAKDIAYENKKQYLGL